MIQDKTSSFLGSSNDLETIVWYYFSYFLIQKSYYYQI